MMTAWPPPRSIAAERTSCNRFLEVSVWDFLESFHLVYPARAKKRSPGKDLYIVLDVFVGKRSQTVPLWAAATCSSERGQLASPQPQHSVAARRKLQIVRDQNAGQRVLAMEVLQQREDTRGGLIVEIAGRFVGQQ